MRLWISPRLLDPWMIFTRENTGAFFMTKHGMVFFCANTTKTSRILMVNRVNDRLVNGFILSLHDSYVYMDENPPYICRSFPERKIPWVPHIERSKR